MTRCFVSSAVAFILLPSVVQAATVYGGPAYDAVTSTGFQNPSLPYNPGSTAGTGVGVGYADKYVAGRNNSFRGLRWDINGSVELGNLGTSANGVTSSRAFAVNLLGVAVGNSQKYTSGVYNGLRATRWDSNSAAAIELGNIGTNSSGFTSAWAYAVNASSTAVGYASKYASNNANLGDRAVRWNAAGVATELGNIGTTVGGVTYVYANAVNASGSTAGYATKYQGSDAIGDRAVRWDATGTAATELGNLGTDGSGYTLNHANALNNAGTAVGFGTKYVNGVFNGSRAIRWDGSSRAATELGNLGVDVNGIANGNAALAINGAGTAVGYAIKYSAAGQDLGARAVRWESTGTAAAELGNLGTSNGSTTSYAYAINASGTAIGYAVKYPGGAEHAVSWGTDGTAFDLNTMLAPADAAQWTLNEADGISDTNWITGVGTYDPDATGPLRSYRRAFLIKLAYAGDADSDDDVDFNDFLVLQNHFGKPETTTGFAPSDFNYDGVTDFNDFLILQNYFGTSLTSSAVAVTREQIAAMSALALSVPEPTSFVVLGLTMPLVLSRRRRRCA